jgi:hypothetical protein
MGTVYAYNPASARTGRTKKYGGIPQHGNQEIEETQEARTDETSQA